MDLILGEKTFSLFPCLPVRFTGFFGFDAVAVSFVCGRRRRSDVGEEETFVASFLEAFLAFRLELTLLVNVAFLKTKKKTERKKSPKFVFLSLTFFVRVLSASVLRVGALVP